MIPTDWRQLAYLHLTPNLLIVLAGLIETLDERFGSGVSQRQLAKNIGLSPTTTCKALQQLRAMNIVRTDHWRRHTVTPWLIYPIHRPGCAEARASWPPPIAYRASGMDMLYRSTKES